MTNPIYRTTTRALATSCGLLVLASLATAQAGGPPTPAPGLPWSTFLGGSADDAVSLWSCDRVADNGDVIVAGSTASVDFPTTASAFDQTHNGGLDVFVSRFSADGSTLLWSTFIGGSDDEEPRAIAVHPSGDVTVTGWTYSADFPPTGGVHMGATDAFVCTLSANGSLLVGGILLGGSDFDGGVGLHGDGAGGLTVSCYTLSAGLPVSPGAYDPMYSGGTDVYVVRLDTSVPSTPQFVWGTYLGGAGAEAPKHVDVDAAGAVLVAGDTTSTDFPVTGGAFQTTHKGGGRDAFASRLSADGSTLLWSTFLGGSGDEAGNAMAVDGATGFVALGGWTDSSDFPVTAGAQDTSANGGHDAYVALLDPGASGMAQLTWSSYLGGGSEDGANAIAFDGAGGMILVGATSSVDFPTTPGVADPSLGGTWDAFVAHFDSGSSGQLEYSTYLGGSDTDYAYSVDAHLDRVPTVGGPTLSWDFPVTPGTYDTTYNGGWDGFVARAELIPAVIAYCFGDGSASVCPCGNTGGAGEGCANSSGSGGIVETTGSTSVSLDALTFEATNLLHNQPGLLFQGESAMNGGAGFLFGDGLRCAGQNVIRMGVEVPDASGSAAWGPGLAGQGGWTAGDTRYLQVWYRDPNGSPCGASFNLTNGLEVAFLP